jgi:antitoxin (DNA-binding transcriptional repressor) of toxin-antitoxin stability system
MPKVITVTDMMRTFSDVIGKVYYQGESFDIKKGANIVARLSPPKVRPTITGKDLRKFLSSMPHLDNDDIDDFETCIRDIRSQKDTKSFSKWD